jgi:hypothetical protein
MKKIIHHGFMLIVSIILLLPLTSKEQITSVKTGNWNDGTTWTGGSVPGSSDDVIINDGHTVTISSTQSIAGLTIHATDASNYGTLRITTGATLNTTGSTTVNGQLIIDDGTFNEGNSSGDYLYIDGSNSLFSMSGGTLNTSRYFNVKNSGNCNVSGGTMNINSSGGTSSTDIFYVPSGANFTMSAGTINILNGNLGTGVALKYNPTTSNVTGGTIKFTNVKGYAITTMSIGNSLYDINCDVGAGYSFSVKNETSPNAVDCHNFTISSGTAEINSDAALTVNGTITNNGTASNFVVLSDASTGSTGSLIVASGTPQATVQQFVSTYTSNTDGWHFLSAPVSGFTIAGSNFEPVSGTDDLFEFDETATTDNWLNYSGTGTFGDANFVVAKGYLVAYSSTTTTNPKSFSGPINTGSFTENLSYTSGSAWQGWNLLGNPYTSAIDWDLLTKSSSVDGAVYVIRASDGAYISWNGTTGLLTDGIIPPMQGFFVHVTASSQSVTMENTDQVHSATNFYKDAKTGSKNTVIITANGSSGQSKTYIQFREDATKSFDHAIDAYKLFGYSTAPQIYTNDGENLYSINCLPTNLEDYSLPVAVKISGSGNFRLSFSGIDSLAVHQNLSLEDLKTGKSMLLNDQNQYDFTGSPDDDVNRFVLHINGVTGIHNLSNPQDKPLVYTSNHRLVVKNRARHSLEGMLKVFDLSGRCIAQFSLNTSSTASYDLQTTPGIYLVKIVSQDGGQSTHKIVLH